MVSLRFMPKRQSVRQPRKHILRYYADPGRLAALLARVAAQMERGSRAHILAAGRVWDRQRPALVTDLDLAVALNEAFHAQFKCAYLPPAQYFGLPWSLRSLGDGKW